MHIEYRNIGEHNFKPVGIGTKHLSFVCAHPTCQISSNMFEELGTMCSSKRLQRVVGEWEPEDMVRDPSQKTQLL